MPLQTDNLVAMGLGVLLDQPINPYQPILRSGIHLRYGFARERGFPWYGYYLFRRVHRDHDPICVFPPTRSQTLAPLTYDWATPQGQFHCDIALKLDNSFASQNRNEFDLRDSWAPLRFTLTGGQVAREFRISVGLYAGTAGGQESLGSSEQIHSGPPLSPGMDISPGRGIGDAVPVEPGQTNYMALAGSDQIPLRSGSAVRAFYNGVVVAQHEIAGSVGDIVVTTLTADAMDGIEIDGGRCALVEICYVPLLGTENWHLLSDFPYPLCLPSSQAGYPCAGKPASVLLAQSLAKSRVRYGPTAIWDDGRFEELTIFLDELLSGGPTAGAMADRVSTDSVVGGGVDDPTLPSISPLDMLLFGALHPSVAQALGLYWVDETAANGVAYDYFILADHDNSFQGSKMIAQAAASGGQLSPGVDGWVLSNLKKENPPPLPPPDGPVCYALPGGVVASSEIGAAIPVGMNTVGLCWSFPRLIESEELLGTVFYQLWRCDLGSAVPSTAPADPNYALLNPNSPIVVTDIGVMSDPAMQYASDWPPFRLFAYDRQLADGWYSYRVSGIDVFGRFSALSDPAQWQQWQPIPEPRPWYYVGDGSNAQLSAYAVHVRDTTAPPPPPGVEAYALDPLDPMLVQDARFAAWLSGGWWAGLSTAQRTNSIGVRVSWRWTSQQILQAPDTKEFRIYFHPGSSSPAPDSRDVINWDARIFVVPFADHVSVDANGDRAYDVLLPLLNDASFSGVPLAPDNTNPVVYGHVGVSAADDKSEAADDAKWQTSPFGNRSGNEGRLGVPAKIYRVLRAPPPPPGVVDPSDRALATPADYHSVSYYTFRWPKPATDAALVDALIFRAMDEALFEFDFRQRPRVALDVGNDDLFPVSSWNTTTRAAIAAELDALNALAPIMVGDTDTATTAKIRAALPAYRELSDNALRTLASLPGDNLRHGNDGAFAQITVLPLRHSDATYTDRIGPDGTQTYVPDSVLCAYQAELDGRARNRYFFRVAFVNAAHDIGALGPSSPPVYLPKVESPRTPAITRVLGGDRQIAVSFASNREDDVAEYRVYRGGYVRRARDIRLMTLVGTVAETQSDPALRPREVIWADTGLPAGTDFHYRLTVRDTADNESPPTAAVIGRAIDLAPVVVPQCVSAQWVLYDSNANAMLPWSATLLAPYLPAVRLEFTSTAAFCAIYRRRDGDKPWHVIAASVAPVAGEIVLFDLGATASDKTNYRAAGINLQGATSPYSAVLTVDPQ